MTKEKDMKITTPNNDVSNKAPPDSKGESLLPNKQKKDDTPVSTPEQEHQKQGFDNLTPEQQKRYTRVMDMRSRQGLPLLNVDDFLAQYPDEKSEED